MEPARRGLLDQKPRDPKEPILNRSLLSRIGGQGLLIAVVTMIAFYLGYQAEGAAMASTMAFSTLTLARLFHGFNCRAAQSIFRLKFSTNKGLRRRLLRRRGAPAGGTLHPRAQGPVHGGPAFGVTNLEEILLLALAPTVVIQIVKIICDGPPSQGRLTPSRTRPASLRKRAVFYAGGAHRRMRS